jgi:hypothetical protein
MALATRSRQAPASTRAYQFDLPIQTEGELELFLLLTTGFRIPKVRVCENHCSPWEAFCDAYFCRSGPVSVWKAARAFGGKTFTLGLLSWVEVITQMVDVNVLGGSGEQSTRVHEYTQQFWQHPNAPSHLLLSDPTMKQTRLSNGANIRTLMASQASVRGPHPVKLRCDEVDEMEIEILNAALGQPMSKGEIKAHTVLSSTHQYAMGTMTEVLQRAADNDWPVFQWCFEETSQPHGWLPVHDIELKKQTVPKAVWDNEFCLQDPAPDIRAINTEKVLLAFRRSLGEFAGGNQEYIEIEPPDPEGEYSTGADWARKRDWTIIVTLRTDTHPKRVVAWERSGRMPWPAMIGKLNRRLDRYGGNCEHDATGLGDVVDDYIEHEDKVFPYIIYGTKKRYDLVSNYIGAIERGDIVYPWIRFAEVEHRLSSVDDVYSQHTPDSIVAGALAYDAIDKERWARGPAG